jgi:hypothetical protein
VPDSIYQKKMNFFLIPLLLFCIMLTTSYAQHNLDSASTHHKLSDSLQIYQNINSLEELEIRLARTQNDLLRKQAQLASLEEKIKMKEICLQQKMNEIQPQNPRNGFFAEFSLIFFIIGLICLVFSFFKIIKT